MNGFGRAANTNPATLPKRSAGKRDKLALGCIRKKTDEGTYAKLKKEVIDSQKSKTAVFNCRADNERREWVPSWRDKTEVMELL